MVTFDNTVVNTTEKNQVKDNLNDAVNSVIKLAKDHLKHDRLDEAKHLYIEVLNINPNDANANHDLGFIEAITEGPQTALPRFKRAVQFAPENEQFWVTYFDALTQLNDFEAAKTALKFGQQYGLKKETAIALASEFNIKLESVDDEIIRLPKLTPISLDSVSNFASNTYWGVSDKQRFDALMREAITLVNPGSYLGDNLFTWSRNNSFLDDTVFKKAWEKNVTSDADVAIAWRRYILACSAYHCMHLDGDFVECGVYNGTGIKTVIDYMGETKFPKTFWGYDTFDYNPVKGHAFAGQEAGFYEKVKDRFVEYPQVKLIKGFIPDSFEQGAPQKIAYLHIDLNNAEGEIAALEHLFDKVVSGGMIILDDYEWSNPYRAQKQAEDPWFEMRGYHVFPLPTGQGFVLKR